MSAYSDDFEAETAQTFGDGFWREVVKRAEQICDLQVGDVIDELDKYKAPPFSDAFWISVLRRAGEIETTPLSAAIYPGSRSVDIEDTRSISADRQTSAESAAFVAAAVSALAVPSSVGGPSTEARLAVAAQGVLSSAIYSQSESPSELEQWLFQAIEVVRSDDHLTFNLDAARRLLGRIGAAARSRHLPAVLAAVCVENAKLLRHAGHDALAVKEAREAVQISQEEGFRRTEILAAFELGMIKCAQDGGVNFRRAEELLSEGDHDLKARVKYGRAREAHKHSHLAEAITLLRESMGLYNRVGDTYGFARASARLGSYLRLRGDFHGAKKYLREAVDIARRHGFRRIEGNVLVDLGQIDRLTGRDIAAHATLRSAEVLFSEIGHILGQSHALVALAPLELRRGNVQEAIETASEAVELYREWERRDSRGNSAPTALALRRLGECMEGAGRLDEAEARLAEAIEVYRQLDHADGEALALTAMARVLSRKGEDANALATAMKGLERISDMPGRLWQGVDARVLPARHSWCYRTALRLAEECGDESALWTAFCFASLDKKLRERRMEYREKPGRIGETVRKLTDVELMMRPPAFDPDAGLVVGSHASLGSLREALLDDLELIAPDLAKDFRSRCEGRPT